MFNELIVKNDNNIENYFDGFPDGYIAVKGFTELGELIIIVNPNCEQRKLFFLANEVSNVLGYYKTNNAIKNLSPSEYRGLPAKPLSEIKDLERNLEKPVNPAGMVIITEPGLYRLLGKSPKTAAENFRIKVNHEILPEIRKTGSYNSQEQVNNKEVVSVLNTLSKQITFMSEELAKLRPLGEFFNIAISFDPEWVDAATIARILNTKFLDNDPSFPKLSTHTLLQALRNQGYIYKNHVNNLPMQHAIDARLMTHKFTEFGKPTSTLFNQNNLFWIIGALKREGIYPLESPLYSIKNQIKDNMLLLNMDTSVDQIQ